MGTLPKSFKNVAVKKMVVLGAEEKCVTTIPGLPYHSPGISDIFVILLCLRLMVTCA